MMEQENLKLRCLIRKAMELQNHGSKRRYRDVSIATTITEDQMAHCYVACSGGPAEQKATCSSESQESSSCNKDNECEEESSNSCNNGNGNGNNGNNICDVTKALRKLKVCCPADKRLVEEITCILMKATKDKGKDNNKDPCDPCGQKKTRKPTVKPCGPSLKRSQSSCGNGNGGNGGNGSCNGGGSKSGGQNLNALRNKIKCMQSSVNKLMKEISKRENGNGNGNGNGSCPNTCPQKPSNFCCEESDEEDECNGNGNGGGNGFEMPKICPPPNFDEVDPLLACGGNRNSKSNQLEKMKQNYLHLLSQYEKKSTQCNEMEKRIKTLNSGCKSDNPNPALGPEGADAELELLRERVLELREEQAEYKCLIKEQASQLEDYRQKYLLAQQTVEEQCVMMEKLSMNNKRIEKQINQEVKEIRAKFQEKLNDLMHLPKLLENEQIKLSQCCKEKEELQAKLALVCKELKQIKDSKVEGKTEDCRPKLLQCTMELEKAKAQIEELIRQRDLFCEQLTQTQDDLDTLRSESAKIIARTKERTEVLRQQMQEQIDKLERELAQCRATATLSVTDREAVIREMQGQLNTLSYSFDAAQKQIKTLRNHIAYVSNENCYPVKC